MANLAYRPAASHRSRTQPACEQASNTTAETGSRVSMERTSSGVVWSVRNPATRVQGLHQQATLLYRPTSNRENEAASMAGLPGSPRHAWILSVAEDSRGIMKRKLQVFMSSTYADMREERQAAVEAILRAGHIPAGMELFAAGDESQLETIRRWIDDSDVFMLILGGRYGSIESKTGKSYIELEYEYALKQKKPLFAAVISDAYLEAKVKVEGLSAIDTVNGSQLKAFREVVTTKICRFFGDVNELKLIVFESLSTFDRNEGLVGWIRGTDAIDPKATLEELSRLQAENISLLAQVHNLEAYLSTASAAGQRTAVGSLSVDAKELLVSAKRADGYILYVRYLGGSALQAGNRNFIQPENSSREDARWKGALDELRERRLVESIGQKGETFQVTKLGYEVGDEIEKSMGA